MGVVKRFRGRIGRKRTGQGRGRLCESTDTSPESERCDKRKKFRVAHIVIFKGLCDRYLYGTAYRRSEFCPELCKPCRGPGANHHRVLQRRERGRAGDQFAFIVELGAGVESDGVVALELSAGDDVAFSWCCRIALRGQHDSQCAARIPFSNDFVQRAVNTGSISSEKSLFKRDMMAEFRGRRSGS